MQSLNELKKNLKRDYAGLKVVRIAVLADSASQLLVQALKGYGHSVNINFEIYEADYNQIDRQILDPSSELYQFSPQYVVVNKCTQKLYSDYCKKDKSEKANYAASEIRRLQQYYDTLCAQTNCKVLINTMPEVNDGIFGNYANKVNTSFIVQLRKLNVGIMELAEANRDLFVYDVALLSATLGRENFYNAKMYVTADMVYSVDALPWLAKQITDIVLSISGTFKKCLILDLDNTTWGGIIGDDGMEGIQVGYLGLGKVYSELQMWAKQLKERGIILAVCSKNTDEIAREPFVSHPDMVLRLDDIAVFVANWETKVDNIRYIQQVLNIGFDSMVFVDDNPFEREMVKSGIPEITVPNLPEDAADYLTYLKDLNLFETASYTDEDEVRTKQYQDESKRQQMMLSFENESDFLLSLEMSSVVAPFSSFSIPRVAQLTQRSNQFNLRTIRYTEEDLRNIVASGSYHTLSLGLRDKFGDHGLICVIILKMHDEQTLFIDSWIMSCRVLKRTMENFTLNQIVKLAKSCGISTITAEYIATKKNALVKDHYHNLGFVQNGTHWVLDVNSYTNKETFITDASIIV